MTYRLALLSTIAVVKHGDGYRSLDLWVRDLEAQLRVVSELVLFAPVIARAPAQWGEAVALPAQVRVVDSSTRDAASLADELSRCEVAQIPGNFTWGNSRSSRQFLQAARRNRKLAIMGISSDRAKTARMNAGSKGPVGRIRAALESASIRVSQRYLARRVDGVFVVGEGLRHLVPPDVQRVFVNTASWIRLSDIDESGARALAPSLNRLGTAARLEPMKGIAVGIDAFAELRRERGPTSFSLQIAGEGPQRGELQAMIDRLGLAEDARMVGALGYPREFFEFLRECDIVVLTNLNDEQPRIVFDAISQGCLLICPDSAVYRSLGLPEELLYERGNPHALAACIGRLAGTSSVARLRQELLKIARAATIETMHERRREWIESLR